MVATPDQFSITMPTFHFFNGSVGIDSPVLFGSEFPNTSGISPFTLPKTSFIIFALNCSEVTYLNVKKPPPNIPKTRIVVTIVKASNTFLMVKLAILKALSFSSVLVLLLIVALSPLYVTMGLMTRQMQEKTN